MYKNKSSDIKVNFFHRKDQKSACYTLKKCINTNFAGSERNFWIFPM